MQMTSSKCMANQFCSVIFMKVNNIEKQWSSLTQSITCTITSLANLMYFRILFSRIQKEVKVLHNLVNVFTSKGFYIANIILFVMLKAQIEIFEGQEQ